MVPMSERKWPGILSDHVGPRHGKPPGEYPIDNKCGGRERDIVNN